MAQLRPDIAKGFKSVSMYEMRPVDMYRGMARNVIPKRSSGGIAIIRFPSLDRYVVVYGSSLRTSTIRYLDRERQPRYLRHLLNGNRDIEIWVKPGYSERLSKQAAEIKARLSEAGLLLRTVNGMSKSPEVVPNKPDVKRWSGMGRVVVNHDVYESVYSASAILEIDVHVIADRIRSTDSEWTDWITLTDWVAINRPDLKAS